jgi:hypothetical protein
MSVEYRYSLTRRELLGGIGGILAGPRRRVLWVMLNPSTALDQPDDATLREVANDPTITKCICFTKRWGWPELHVLNLFAFRSTDPKDLYRAMRSGVDVVGPQNDAHFVTAANWSGDQLIVCAWGAVRNMPGVRNRIARMKELLKFHRLHALGYTKGFDAAHGEPRHPLMLAYETSLHVMTPSVAEASPGA